MNFLTKKNLPNSKKAMRKHYIRNPIHLFAITVFLYLRYTLKFLRRFPYIKILIGIRASEKNNDILIIGGGPSKANLNIDKAIGLQKSGHLKIFTMNTTNIGDPRFQSLKPDYHVLADDTFFEGKISHDWYENNSAEVLDNILKFESSVFSTLPNECRLFFNWSYIREINEKRPSKNNVPICTDITPYFGFNSPWLPGSFWPLVSIHALRIALHMSCKRIFIIGLDHSNYRNFFCDESNKIYYTNDYGHDAQTFDSPEYLEFSDVYYEGYKVFKSYEKFQNHKQIFNLDACSLISCFTKNDPLGLVYD